MKTQDIREKCLQICKMSTLETDYCDHMCIEDPEAVIEDFDRIDHPPSMEDHEMQIGNISE